MTPQTLLLVNRAQENRALVDLLSSDSSHQRGWRMTFLFYAAIFWLKAFFEEEGIEDPESHHRRLKYARQSDDLSPIAEDFSMLQALSETARYTLFATELEDLALSISAFARLQAHVAILVDPESPPAALPEPSPSIETDDSGA